MDWKALRSQVVGKVPRRVAEIVFSTSNGIPFDVDSYVECLGVRVIKTKMNPYYGKLVNRDGVLSVLVNDSLSTHSHRFTVAHELGHLLMHPLNLDLGDLYTDLGFGMNVPSEKQCDIFAMHLLMPTNIIEQSILGGASVKDLSRIFQVTEAAVSRRLQLLV